MEQQIAKLKEELERSRQLFRATNFHLRYAAEKESEAFDFKGYFSILGFSQFQFWEDIRPFLEAHYRIKTAQLHPDKTGNGDAQKLLNEAIEIFRDEQKFDKYTAECHNRATIRASRH